MFKLGSFSSTRQLESNLDRWLARRGLRGNPFERWNAEHDRDLPNYFVDVGGFDELLCIAEPCIVFARRGCGKTAQRQMLAAHYRPFKRHSSQLAVTYSYSGFERALGDVNDDIRQLRPTHHVSALLHLGLTALVKEASHDSGVQGALASPDAASRLTAYVARFAPHLPVPSTATTSITLDNVSSLGLLQGFAELIKDAGLDSCVVLVDGLDEFPLTADDPAQAVAFLAPLLGTLSLIECPGLAFKFFLPQELEPALRACRWFRVDRLHLFRIAWNRGDLLSLIEQRLIHFSQRQPPYEALGQLCEDELAQVIDGELISLAEGLPRALLILADMLLQSHCQQPNPPELITLNTWEQVKVKWLTRRDDFVMGEEIPVAQREMTEFVVPSTLATPDYPVLRAEEETGLVWLGEHDITSAINPQDHRVLICLYQHQGALCSKDLLAREAWLGVDQEEDQEEVKVEGVSDQAIAASIARLRRMLAQFSPDEGYIETVRGRGYRLYPEGFRAA